MKTLVERKQAFTAGAIWLALGPRLMDHKATIRAKVAQIENKKDWWQRWPIKGK